MTVFNDGYGWMYEFPGGVRGMIENFCSAVTVEVCERDATLDTPRFLCSCFFFLFFVLQSKAHELVMMQIVRSGLNAGV